MADASNLGSARPTGWTLRTSQSAGPTRRKKGRRFAGPAWNTCQTPLPRAARARIRGVARPGDRGKLVVRDGVAPDGACRNRCARRRRVLFRGADGAASIEYAGKYIEIVAHRRLAFTLSLRQLPHVDTRVTVDIAPIRNGCELSLTHENVPADHASHTRRALDRHSLWAWRDARSRPDSLHHERE